MDGQLTVRSTEQWRLRRASIAGYSDSAKANSGLFCHLYSVEIDAVADGALFGQCYKRWISQTQQAPHPFKSDRPQESHDSAFETGFDIAILFLDPDAFLIEAQNVSDIVGMTGQITRGSHVGQDRPTEHLFFPPHQTLWNFNDLSFL